MLARLAELAEAGRAPGDPGGDDSTGKSAIADVHRMALGVFGNWVRPSPTRWFGGRHRARGRLAPGSTDTCFENPELLDADRQAVSPDRRGAAQRRPAFPVKDAIVADAREALAALVAELKRGSRPRSRPVASAARPSRELKTLHRYFAEPEQRSDSVPLRPERVITELSRRSTPARSSTMDAAPIGST